MIDLRSDTVTLPDKGMLDAIANAKLGDDVFGEDPTTIELEEYSAKLFGMEKALFIPSGTMSNQIAIRCHTVPGDEVICHKDSHVYNFEGGGIAINSGCSTYLLEGSGGVFTKQDIADSIHDPANVHFPLSKLVVIENTCNKGGGTIWNFKDIQEISQFCRSRNLRLHLDGARLFNALVETGESAPDYGKVFDSISICLSKGLGAPVGSVLIGNSEFIAKARRVRKYLGGGMRQSGILASAGLYALRNNILRLKDDHKNARMIGEELGKKNWVVDLNKIQTNIILFTLRKDMPSSKFLGHLKDNGIIAIAPFGNQVIRLVTHMGITSEDAQKVVNAIRTCNP